MSVLTVILFVSLAMMTSVSGDDPIVETKLGKVSGVSKVSLFQKKQYYSFLGIPYAEPPLGDLRFMQPQPIKEWDDIFEAHKEPEACAQSYMSIRSRYKNGYFGNEDCLYLSVHTPRTISDSLPVIVFLLNEQFKSSYNGSIDYSPDFFIEDDVIVVTLAHRLGSIGFLSMEDDLLPGNNGLRDIILALQWIQDHIHSFGGDRTRVTLMGSSGGAVAADVLLHSKQARGLFSAVILQSGTAWNSMYFGNEPKRETILLSDAVGKKAITSSTLLKNLRKVPAALLLEKELTTVHDDYSRAVQRGVLPFGPSVEHDHADAVVTARPEETPLDIDVPVMIGFNSREGIEYSSRYLERPSLLTYADRDFMFVIPIRKNFHVKVNDPAYRDAIQEIKDFYFEEGYVKTSKPGEFITYIGDVISVYPIDYAVRQYANATKAPIYYYTFDYYGLLNAAKIETLSNAKSLDGTWGATRQDELCYLFVCNSIKKKYLNGLKNPEEFEELKVIRKMVRMWSNFARTSNPTPPEDDDILNGFTWTQTTAAERNVLEITKNLKMRKNHLAGRMKFWDDFLRRYEEKAVDGVVKTARVKEDGEEDFEELFEIDLEESGESEDGEDPVPIVTQTKVRIAVNDEL